MNERPQSGLYIWGKSHPSPKLLKSRTTAFASGQNHLIYQSGRNCFGLGSNRFGQLGLKQPQIYQQPITIFQNHTVKSIHCGPEHSLFINDKNEVYSMGLNIKGQLGQQHFDNVNTPTIIPSLLPGGKKNPRALSSSLPHPPKSSIVQILQKFDLQVKIDQPNQQKFLLQSQEHIVDIACGALFTIVLSNKGRVFVAGLIGSSGNANIDQQSQKTKFKQVTFNNLTIAKINAGLSGAAVIATDGSSYIWGRFGKIVINVPRKIEKQRKGSSTFNEDKYHEVKVADQCVFALTLKGQILAFGENIDGQLGCQRHKQPFRDYFSVIAGAPFAKKIEVGRNSVFAVSTQNGHVFAWGSNKYGQIIPEDNLKGILPITDLGFILEQGQTLLPTSYTTLFHTTRNPSTFFLSFTQPQKQQQQQTINKSQYKKLLQDYQLLKSMNIALLQKNQPTRKLQKQVQTISKFQINGITQHRKFNSNTEIAWKQLQIQSQISEGGYGIIYRAKWRQIQVVVKKFKIQNGDVSLRDFLSECHAMEAVRHPNIVMFLGAVTSNPHYSIILEYCGKGSLWSYLQNKENNISWQDRRRFAIEIAQGVLYLHLCSPPILHRDLKSLNIFLDVNLKIKIGDFGWTKTLEQYMTNKIGTYQWMAPQVIGCKPYTQKADVFSYSIILWEIASREPPYRNINGTKVSEQVLNRDLRPTIPPKTPEPWSKLMRRCWQSDPNRRPTFRQIIRQLQLMKLA